MHFFDRLRTDVRGKVLALSALLTFFAMVLVYERYMLAASNSLQPTTLSSQRVNTTSASSLNGLPPLPCVASQDRDEETNEGAGSISIETKFFNYLAFHLQNTTYPGIDIYVQYLKAHKRIKQLKYTKSLQPDFGTVINDVNFNYTLTVNTCRPALTNLSVFIAITSAPRNFEKRRMIRETWLRHRNMFSNQLDVVEVAFVLGLSNSSDTEKTIAQEHKTNGDILQVDMFDTYYNLSLKDTALFNWLDKNCNSVEFVLKVDDDVYVNLDNLIRTMHRIKPAKPAVYGWYSDSLPHRDGTWAISFEDWPWSNYPGYLRGPANLISQTAVRRLLAAAQTVPYHPFDDLFVSGLCAEKAGIHIYTSDKFFAIDVKHSPDPCQVRQSITWLTYSSTHMNNSHFSAERLYNGSSRCDQPVVNIKNETITLQELLYYSFSEIQR